MRRCRSTLAAGTLLALLAGLWLAAPAREQALSAKPAEGVVPLYPKTTPARNAAHLVLHDDGARVVGWLSGAPVKGTVTVHDANGTKLASLELDAANTFTWKHKLDKPTPVTFRARWSLDETASRLRERTLLVGEKKEESPPCVFFVVDRNGYRPGQALHFAGFLRRLTPAGEFEPVADAAVDVQLTSETKHTRVAQLKLTSDDHGKIAGSYTFTDADPLDGYSLAIPKYKGTARLLLGEYRKSKVKLKIDSELKPDSNQLKLQFSALDFLDKPVAASKASFVAQVVHDTRRKTPAALNAEEFIYHTSAPMLFGQTDDLPEDEALLLHAQDLGAAAWFPTGGARVVTQLSGDLNLNGSAPGEHTLKLKKEWLEGGHSVMVQGVIVDANGREQRATKSIPLGEPLCPGVKLELIRSRFTTDEKITVRAVRKEKTEANASSVGSRPAPQPRSGEDSGLGHAYEGPLTLVAMRLAPGYPQAENPYAYGDFSGYGYGYRYGRYRRWAPPPAEESVKRTMVTAVPFGKDGTVSLRLTEPGAYKLVAVGQREDGNSVRTEIGCVVQRADELPTLTLKLDHPEIKAGDRLTGAIHSKYADARVLLVVRDSSGVRLHKPLQLRDGIRVLDEELPADLRYGCSVEVEHPEAEGRIASATQFLRVVPRQRMLEIKTALKESIGPGETVKLDIDVQRAEEVDLIVSVYDQALLAISPDRATDIRNFFLADDRARQQVANQMLRRRLGGVTLEELIRKAEVRLKADSKLAQTPEGEQLNQALSDVRGNSLYQRDLPVLFRLAGIDVVAGPFYGYWHVHAPDLKVPLASLLDHVQSNASLKVSLVNDTLVVSEFHPDFAAGAGQMLGFQQLNAGYGGYGAGLNRRANADFARISGNASQSFAEGQAVASHLPAGPAPVALLDADQDQGHIFVRRDFSDSAYWNARVRTDKNGKATVEFKVPDSLTNWQVVVTGVSKRMHVGQAKASFRTFKPIMVWPMLPRSFTEGDRVELFGAVHNRTQQPQEIKVRLKVENGEVLSAEEKTVQVPAHSSVNVYWNFRPRTPGFTQLLMTADCPAGSDASLKRLPVYRAAVEQVVTASGQVRKEAALKVPAGVDLNSARLEISFAPSLAADLADTLNFLVDYPYGCVEQTMSRFLPAIKVAQILRQYDVNHPELNKKLPGCVSGGIKRLLELQQAGGGWGWHGSTNTHEMMTPYALYGLLQAEKAGYTIPNETAINRGLAVLKGFIQHMGKGQEADRIYCIYVYAHRHAPEKAWWDFLEAEQKNGKLSDYATALALEICVQHGNKELAERFATDLRARAKKSESGQVFWTTAGFSRWMEDRFEITAAAMKALVAHDKDDPLIDGILLYFAANKRGDRWNSTKDTAMILFAMCDYLSRVERSTQGGKELTFRINDRQEQKVVFEDQLTRKVTLPGTVLKPGKNTLSFQTDSSGVMYRAVLRYWKTGENIPPLAKGITVERKFYLVDEKTKELKPLKSGDSVRRGSYLVSEVTASRDLSQPMTYLLMENPKPGTAEVLPVDDPRFAELQPNTGHALREERLASVAFHYEATGAVMTNRCVLLAELAGNYVVAPAWVELMYETETRGHSGTFHLKVVE